MPLEFAFLRKLFCGGDSEFIHSMARAQSWEAKEGGGATKAKFVNTMDGIYMLKGIQSVELRNFQTFAQNYFEYLFTARTSEVPTMLVKKLGLFSIEVRNSNGFTQKNDFVVMEKLFSDCQISRTFDLKGSLRNRLKPDGAPVLQDENLRRLMYSTPLVVDEASKGKFGLAIWNDSFFLSQVGVMDYSILVGVDDKNGRLVVGIIDYIRPYSWDKQLEYVMKATPGIIAGTGKRPTVVSPDIYRDRFRQATWLYFVMSPSWNTVVLKPGRPETEEDAKGGHEVPLGAPPSLPPLLIGYEEVRGVFLLLFFFFPLFFPLKFVCVCVCVVLQ